ncbi:hypothetical protein QYF36_020555 [Acer negundo]|nr:hypothetical protein QYF36_020555 [Acer negundo]
MLCSTVMLCFGHCLLKLNMLVGCVFEASEWTLDFGGTWYICKLYKDENCNLIRFEANGKVYFSEATPRGLIVFNQEDTDDDDNDDQEKGEAQKKESSSDVQSCLFPHATANGNALMMNLMLAALLEATVSFLFMLSPTRRRRIGFACKIAEGLALRIIVGCGLAFKIAAGESLVSDPRVGAGLRRDQTRVDGSSTRPVPVLGRGLAVGGEGIAGSLAEFLVVGRRRDAVSAVLVTGGAKMNGGA